MDNFSFYKKLSEPKPPNMRHYVTLRVSYILQAVDVGERQVPLGTVTSCCIVMSLLFNIPTNCVATYIASSRDKIRTCPQTRQF